MNDDAFYFPGEMRQSGHFTGMPCLMVPLSEHQAAQESLTSLRPQLSVPVERQRAVKKRFCSLGL
jgi:hypothetical protein